MKTFIISYKFLFVTLLSLPLAMCSNDNEDITQDFEPITINLSGLDVHEEDTSFVVNGFTFTNFGSESLDYLLNNDGNIIAFNGIALWHNGTSFNYIEMDLSEISEASKITVKVFNNGTTTPVTLYDNTMVVEEIQAPYNISDVIFNVEDKTFDRLRIASAEGAAISIKLE